MESVEPGRCIAGRYRLGAVIGRGGMGAVWQARDELLSRDVAVKELVWPAYFSLEERQAACRRATREAQLAARLNHRNVIRIFDIVEEDGCPWIVMELVPHRSLRDLIKEEGPLSPAAAAEVGRGILAALCAAHEAGIVHRDVKPANILMAPDRVVLTDFGIARAAGTSALTTVGTLIGSPSYIAPERARGRGSGAPGDLWGLGASLYAAVEGHGPFDRAAGALASLTAVVADELEPATHAGPLWPVISGLLRKDPDERLDAVAAERMLSDVSMIGASVGLVSVSGAVPAGTATPRPRRSRGRAMAFAGSGALAVIAVSSAAWGLTLVGSPRHQAVPAAASAPIAASTPSATVGRPAPAARLHPSATARAHQRTPARTHLTARTSRVRTTASSTVRPASAPPRSSSRKAGWGATLRGSWGHFLLVFANLEWRSHSVHWPRGTR
jgi:tRNA A-37 threonylcarbamoyl transferase component Bud32